MTIQQILDEVLALAGLILPLAGQPQYAALVAIVQPALDDLITKLTADLSRTAAWTADEQVAFQARIDAIRTDPAWQVTP